MLLDGTAGEDPTGHGCVRGRTTSREPPSDRRKRAVEFAYGGQATRLQEDGKTWMVKTMVKVMVKTMVKSPIEMPVPVSASR